MPVDEFEVIARSADKKERRWTRSRLEAAIAVAESAVDTLGYVFAVVVNIHNGHRSDPLHLVVDNSDDAEPPTVRMPRPKRRAA